MTAEEALEALFQNSYTDSDSDSCPNGLHENYSYISIDSEF